MLFYVRDFALFTSKCQQPVKNSDVIVASGVFWSDLTNTVSFRYLFIRELT